MPEKSKDNGVYETRGPPVESMRESTTYMLASILSDFTPGLGGLTSELISRRREERLRTFLKHIVGRIENLEAKVDVIKTPACLEMLEEAAEQAVHGEHDLKRIALSRLMANTINEGMVNHETDRLLLAILKEMTDYELLHLLHDVRSTRYELDPRYQEFLERSQRITEPRHAHMNSGREELDAHAVQAAHKSRLERLGLFVFKGNNQRGHYESTSLGRLLLRRIGAISTEGLKQHRLEIKFGE